jgi:RecA/RadA recombinase
MNNALMTKLLKSGSIKESFVLGDSPYFLERDMITTDLPILNVAFSGKIDGGLVPGLTIFAGASKSFKTMLALYCMKAYFNKYPDSICLFYDTEFGTPPSYLNSMGIDTSRVIHIPVEHVEQLKFDVVSRLKEVKRGDRVFIMVDSLGNLASKKEVEDAEEEKSTVDMTRAKSIRSLLRIITPHLTMKDLPCIIINHVYQTMEMYSKVVIPGGTAVTYAANQIFVISKAQEKDSTGELDGYKFTINIEKSRYVKEKSKLPFTVKYKEGISKWSGLLDLALLGNYIVKPKQGWYALVDRSTGEILGKNYREKDINNDDDVWNTLLKKTDFPEFIKRKYLLDLNNGTIAEEDDAAETLQSEED